MYNFRLHHDEKIVTVSDKTLLLGNDISNHPVTTIITNRRLLILDFPKDNSKYKRKITLYQKIFGIKKEIVIERNIEDIDRIGKGRKGNIIYFKDNVYLKIEDKEIIEELKDILNSMKQKA